MWVVAGTFENIGVVQEGMDTISRPNQVGDRPDSQPLRVREGEIRFENVSFHSLDSEVEAAIQEQLYNLMEGKTVIAIAHRLSTIAAMDRLVIMDRGRIVEDGSHGELLQRGGLYATLWARQSGGFLAKEAAE